MSDITQQQLDIFKNIYSGDARIQALTLDEVLKNTGGKTADWNSVQLHEPPTVAGVPAAVVTNCQMAVGYIVFDVIAFSVGAVGLVKTVKPQTIQAVALAAAPVLSKIEVIIAQMAAPNASKTDLAKGVFRILQIIYNGGSLGAVLSAITASLSWWDMVLYGITATATVIAALATDGVAFVAEIALLLTTAGFLTSHIVNAVQACSLTPALSASVPDQAAENPTNPFPFEPVIAIQTANGNYMTVVDNGGLGGTNVVAIQTNRRDVGPWEKFNVQTLDPHELTFALTTMTGNYVTAINGGGIGEPSDVTSPIHTDAVTISPTERLTLVQQPDGSYALCTSTGYYLTAVNGGGVSVGTSPTPIATDRFQLGPWETFTLVKL